jgi:hypothetical protein
MKAIKIISSTIAGLLITLGATAQVNQAKRVEYTNPEPGVIKKSTVINTEVKFVDDDPYIELDLSNEADYARKLTEIMIDDLDLTRYQTDKVYIVNLQYANMIKDDVEYERTDWENRDMNKILRKYNRDIKRILRRDQYAAYKMHDELYGRMAMNFATDMEVVADY